MNQHKPDDSLVRRAVKREKTAFTALYDKYVDQVYRHIQFRVSERTDAEDITQEVFIRAWKAIDRYKITGAPFSAWLISIARNLIIDHYRSRSKMTTVEPNREMSDAPENRPQELNEANMEKTLIRSAIHKLKGDKRKVIQMRFIDGFSYAEIARIICKKEGAVRVIQYRALKDLKDIVEKHQKENEHAADDYNLHRRDISRQVYLGGLPEEISPDR